MNATSRWQLPSDTCNYKKTSLGWKEDRCGRQLTVKLAENNKRSLRSEGLLSPHIVDQKQLTGRDELSIFHPMTWKQLENMRCNYNKKKNEEMIFGIRRAQSGGHDTLMRGLNRESWGDSQNTMHVEWAMCLFTNEYTSTVHYCGHMTVHTFFSLIQPSACSFSGDSRELSSEE